MSDKGCELCNQKPVFTIPYGKLDPEYDKGESAISVASGGWTECFIGVAEDGKLGCFGWGDGDTDFYYFNYCPQCGRKLTND